MYPWRLIAILEDADPSFQDVFYPKSLRCRLDKRIVRAMEEHWPAYFPTRKECRGPSWSLAIHENEPLYKPQPKSRLELEQWKKDIKGTIAEIRAYGADISWNRFAAICRKIPGLRPLLMDFKPLADWLTREESMWPRHHGVMVGQEDYLQGQMQALLAPDSPYRHSDPIRLQFLDSNKPTSEKLRVVQLMRSLFDRPLMILAVLQTCASESQHSQFWLPIQNHVDAITKTLSPLIFRKTWLEHAMQVSGAIKKNGKSCPRKWARKLLSGKSPDLDVINAKAIEVNRWLKGKKQPSLENVRRAGRLVFTPGNPNLQQNEIGNDLWLFSWMIVLWLEKHFTEIAAEFKGDSREIRHYYRRFFHYLKIDWPARNG
jgi:hypothetical protein